MGFNCLKATEPPQGDSLLFTTKFPGIPEILSLKSRSQYMYRYAQKNSGYGTEEKKYSKTVCKHVKGVVKVDFGRISLNKQMKLISK